MFVSKNDIISSLIKENNRGNMEESLHTSAIFFSQL